jgi:diguanylate cyclase (GGDEF)-like protein
LRIKGFHDAWLVPAQERIRMASQLRTGPGAAFAAFGPRVVRLVADARLEAALIALLLLTVAALAWQDRILERTTRLTPQSIQSLARIGHGDDAVGGHTTIHEEAPFRWSCELKTGFDYPYCGYEVFFGKDKGSKGLDLTNFRSLTVSLVYRGPGKSFRVHLKNFDPRYAVATTDDSAKFNRVEYDTTPGRVQHVTFNLADFGVADWWLRKHQLAPSLSHPQFDNITSLDIQTGTEPALGHHEFEVREVVLRTTLLSDAQWYLSLLGAWIVLIGVYLAYRIRNMKGEIERRGLLQALAQRQAEEAEEAARRDPLTKVYNRRGIAERYATLCDEAAAPAGMAVMLIDIDRFKSLNDRFGHAYGDEVLSTIAAVIKRNVRAGDTVGRWGGEEFVVLCPGADSGEAQHIAEKIRRRIEHFHFGECEKVTASLGTHWFPATGPELAELIGFADIALYAAKHGGRNRCSLYRPGMAKAA